MVVLRVIIFSLLLLLQSCAYHAVKEEGSLFLEKRRTESLGTFVVLDPGHGGKDEGCKSKNGECIEKNLALKTAKLVQQYLKSQGIKSVLTRSCDEFVPLEDRANFANKRNAHLFVSIHFNSAENTQAKGVEVYYDDENTCRAEQSKILARILLAKVIDYTKAPSRGLKTEDLRVIRKTIMPAVLVEPAFLSNPQEALKCKDPKYQEAIARAIADAIEEYVRNVPGAN
ncbi:MAG: N-acetylmuramoyl-L-alanine amidase [Chlamydiales bacterium]|nr:N-acetylmuramoyl-L-alanine amidase [Chlamydiales bacterium]